MFTKNWYKALACAMTGQNTPGCQFKSHQGSDFKISTASFVVNQIGKNVDKAGTPSLHKVRTAYNTYGGVVFGTGTTPPTKDDYCLSGDLITTISCSSAVDYEFDDTGITFTAIYTITNTGSSDITIGEIGLMCGLYSDSDTNALYKSFVERTVLDTPVTITAGGLGQVTYTIRMNYPA